MVARTRGSTLVELAVVILILGIIAAIAAPRLLENSQQASQEAFVHDLFTYVDAAMRFHAVTGDYLEDSSTGKLPTGFESFVHRRSWEKDTPIGGKWDAERDSYGVTSAV